MKRRQSIDELADAETLEWWSLTPAQRFVESQKLWSSFLALGGSLDPEPDSQSPFYFEEAPGSRAPHGRSGLHRVRRGRVQSGHRSGGKQTEHMLTTAQRAFQMLENESLWTLTRRVHRLLSQHDIAHAIVGGVAVCLHGYHRNTVDLDLLIDPEDASTAQSMLKAEGLDWSRINKEFRSASGVAVHFVMAGERQGPDQEARFPHPGDSGQVTEVEGLPVLSLAQLIQSKLACGLGNMRRTHKDFADVVELIAIHRLDGSYARNLHKSVRKEFRQLVRHARGS
jgi:hypothetical protein